MIQSPPKNINKEFRSIIKRWVDNNLETLSVAKVVNVSQYGSKRLIDVLPLSIEKRKDGDNIVPDVIHNCPVVLQGNVDGFVSFPIKNNDKVIIGYCKESISEFVFSNNLNQYLPDDYSSFGGNDAVVLGYIGQANIDLPVDPNNFKIKYQQSEIEITPSNKITITEPGSIITMESSVVNISNSNGNATLQSNGEWDINGAKITPNGDVITANGVSVNNHYHNQGNDSDNNSQQPTSSAVATE